MRTDVPALGRHLRAWDVRLARDGNLHDWDGRDLTAAHHQICARPDDGFRPDRWQGFADPSFVEFLAEDLDADGMWVYRRDPAGRASVERLGSPCGFLHPEVGLLYKAGAAVGNDPTVSAKAQSDFDHLATLTRTSATGSALH